MSDKKFKFVDPTKEEEDAFMNDFKELAVKHGLYVEAIPQFVRGEGENSKNFEVRSTIFLQKSVEDDTSVVEAEKVETGVLSTDPELNPQA